jgi:hypothetical protein
MGHVCNEVAATRSRGRWLLAVAQCVFDLDTGQKVQKLEPEGSLTPEEQQSIAYHSFPV